jgi:hypothetical protein
MPCFTSFDDVGRYQYSIDLIFPFPNFFRNILNKNAAIKDKPVPTITCSVIIPSANGTEHTSTWFAGQIKILAGASI